MSEHITRAFYYAGIHLLFASTVSIAALALASIPRGSATMKYWIWVATSLNFILPVGATLDWFWAAHLSWAKPIGIIGGEIHDTLENAAASTAVGLVWLLGAAFMAFKLFLRLWSEGRASRAAPGLGAGSAFPTRGVPVRIARSGQGPAVEGLLRPYISLPDGIDRLLTRRELDAVLIHERTHAIRRDNLIRLIYEVGLCGLWFHPLVWLSGSRLALYRELSCDERVIQSGHGGDLVSALTKLADPGEPFLLQATASSFLSHRLRRLGAAHPPQTCRTESAFLSMVFAAVFLGGVFETVAHTACCFIKK